MIYNTELSYFFDTPDFPFSKAFLVTAQTAAQWCDCYQAELIEPKRDTTELKRSGTFVGNLEKDRETVSELFTWIQKNAQSLDLFSFWMYPGNERPQKQVALFDHHDDTCCWVLDICEDQFKVLQKAWKSAGLPEDLFFPTDQWRHIGGRTYTPKQWELR